MATAATDKPSLEAARRAYREEIVRLRALYGWSLEQAAAEIDRTRQDLLVAMWRGQGWSDAQMSAELSRRYGIPTRAPETQADYRKRLKAEMDRQRALGLSVDGAFDMAVKVVGRWQAA